MNSQISPIVNPQFVSRPVLYPVSHLKSITEEPFGQIKKVCHKEHEGTQRKKKSDRCTGRGLIHQTQQVNRLRKVSYKTQPHTRSYLKFYLFIEGLQPDPLSDKTILLSKVPVFETFEASASRQSDSAVFCVFPGFESSVRENDFDGCPGYPSYTREKSVRIPPRPYRYGKELRVVKKKEKGRRPVNNIPGIQAGAGSFSLCHEEKKKNNKEVSREGHEEHEGEKKITNNKSQITKEIGIRQKEVGSRGLIHQPLQVNRLRKGLILCAPSCSSWLKKQITNTSDAPFGQGIKRWKKKHRKRKKIPRQTIPPVTQS